MAGGRSREVVAHKGSTVDHEWFDQLQYSPLQTDGILLASSSQHRWMLHVASICTLCCILWCVAGTCCAKFETGQTLAYTYKRMQ